MLRSSFSIWFSKPKCSRISRALRRETLDVVDEVRPDLGGIGEEPLEIELRGVVEGLPGGPHQHPVAHFGGVAGEFGGTGEDSLLGGLEDAVEATEDRHREDDLPVLGLLVVATEQVGDLPDEVGQGAEIGRGGALLLGHLSDFGDSRGYCGARMRGRSAI